MARLRCLAICGSVLSAFALVAAASASAAPRPTHTLRITVEGGGTVSGGLGRIACGSRCSARFARGRVVGLLATPGHDFLPAVWSGRCTAAGPKCYVVLDRDLEINVTFTRMLRTVAVTVSGPGTLVSDPPGLACG